LHADCQSVKTAAIAHHVSFAQITCRGRPSFWTSLHLLQCWPVTKELKMLHMD